jgi:uncharacterized protein YndB with AHSA1/START domain
MDAGGVSLRSGERERLQTGWTMPEARHQVTIRRPAADVFAFIADGLNGPKWRSGILDISHVSGSGVGATYKQGVKGPGGRRIAADYRITAYEPDTRLAFEAIAGPVRPTGEYVLEAVEGGTRLTFALQAELSGIKKLLMGGAVQKTMDSEVGATERLKGVLESMPDA